MKKQETEIAVNTSSGAEKVEIIEKEVKAQNGAAKRSASTKTNAKVKKEDDAAKARVKAAQKKKKSAEEKKKVAAEKKKAAKEKREKRKAAAQKRKQEKKQAQAERKAKLKAAREEKRRKHAHAIAQKNQEGSKKKKERAKRRAERAERRRKEREERKNARREGRSSGRKSSNGGWIVAVSILGGTTLALTAALTVGAVEMKRTTEGTMTAYRGTMYELTGIMEHVDNDLDRARISATSEQQSRVLTDLLVQARMAELDMEKLPLALESCRGITEFINRTALECERMLGKLRHGETLTEEDFDRLERLYNANHAIRTELDKVLADMTDDSLREFIKKGTGGIAEAMQRIEKSTLEENRIDVERGMQAMQDKMQETKEKMQAKTEDMGKKAAEKSEQGKDMPRIESAHAEQLCKAYFSEYDIDEYQCVGETVSRGYSAYNVQGYDKKGTLLFAEISQTDGALLRFDYYEDCDADTFDLQNAERIARQFLTKLGYEDMEVVRFRDNGTMTDFTFVYEKEGVAYYPDELHVKVCRTRGVVTAMDATKYIRNHKERIAPQVKISMAEAQSRLHDKLTVEASRLAVVRTQRGERIAYEFLCAYGEEDYFVYVDGVTGEEIAIVNAKGIA